MQQGQVQFAQGRQELRAPEGLHPETVSLPVLRSLASDIQGSDMIILPLRCKDCGRCMNITGSDPMPRCADCGGKMIPNGSVRQEEAPCETSPRDSSSSPLW